MNLMAKLSLTVTQCPFIWVTVLEGKTEALTPKNLLLKGARLKGTDWVIGLALYTGRDSKTALNQPKVLLAPAAHGNDLPLDSLQILNS